MAAKRKLMMLEGHIEGMGRREECSVMAMRVSSQGQDDHYEYAKACIHRAPKDLPDGSYTVVFNGERDPISLVDGRWYAADQPVRELPLAERRLDRSFGPKSLHPHVTGDSSFEVA